MTLLHRQVRERDARELLLLGELISSERARLMGLVNHVVPAEHLMQEAMSLARTVLQGGPESIAQTKKVLDELWPSSFNHELDETLLYHLSARNSNEAREGVAAFLEKRSPSWKPVGH
jgi:methylglutaconyl-CoA hydratase